MYLVNKLVGKTPLQALERCRLENKIAPNTPMTYAGRLDPLAEGLLIILVGEECKDKERYLGLDKTYETEIILGLTTDTYDAMGLPKRASQKVDLPPLQNFVGKFTQDYPPYSSKTVGGRPLFDLARTGELEGVDKEDWPKKEVEIYSLELLGEHKIGVPFLLEQIKSKISSVKGDFRQEQIVKAWEELFVGSNEEFLVIKLHAHVSSGVYIRSLANSLGGVALSIKRVKVGDFYM